jgi:hypothetical protein
VAEHVAPLQAGREAHRQRCGAVCVTRTEVNVRFTSKPTQLLRGNEMTR